MAKFLNSKAMTPKTGTLAFGAISTNYADVLANTAPALGVDITNTTNVLVMVSLGDDAHPFIIPAGQSKFYPLGTLCLDMRSTVKVKGASGPASGQVSVTLIY